MSVRVLENTARGNLLSVSSTFLNVSDAPVELIAAIDDDGRMSARRKGEPSFAAVQDVADAIMAALNRGVDLVVPAELFEEHRGDFPPQLPPYIKVR